MAGAKGYVLVNHYLDRGCVEGRSYKLASGGAHPWDPAAVHVLVTRQALLCPQLETCYKDCRARGNDTLRMQKCGKQVDVIGARRLPLTILLWVRCPGSGKRVNRRKKT